MSEADKLLDSLSEGSNADTEPHFIINPDRTITVPDSLKKIAIQHDHNIETVTFDCFRYWDGHDLSAMKIFVNYMRSDGGMGSAQAEVVQTDEETMSFTWTVSQHVTFVDGPLTILVCIKEVNANNEVLYHWNSELNNDLYVGVGLESNSSIVEKYPDIIAGILSRIDELETLSPSTGGGSVDVQINGVSIVENGVANIPIAGSELAGVIKVRGNSYGVYVNAAGDLSITPADNNQVLARQSQFAPLTPYRIDSIVKVGITDNKEALTEAEQDAAQEWLGVANKLDKTTTSAPTARLYGVSQNGTQILQELDYSNSAFAQAVPKRDKKGAIYIPDDSIGLEDYTFSSGQEAVNKKYVDDNFLVKQENIYSGLSAAYIVKQDGTNGILAIADGGPRAYIIPYYGAAGSVGVNSVYENTGYISTCEPIAKSHAATKNYVDNAVKRYEHYIEFSEFAVSKFCVSIISDVETKLIDDSLSGLYIFHNLVDVLESIYGNNKNIPHVRGYKTTSSVTGKESIYGAYVLNNNITVCTDLTTGILCSMSSTSEYTISETVIEI